MSKFLIDYKIPVLSVIAVIGIAFVSYSRLESAECQLNRLEARIAKVENDSAECNVKAAEIRAKLTSIESLLIELKSDVKRHLIPSN